MTDQPLPTIAFVGLGRMGANMARRLKDCGYTISAVYDRVADHAQAIAAELGAVASPTLQDVTSRAAIIITVVTDDAAMETLFAESGDSLLAGTPSGKVFINCATVTPAIHRVVEARAEARGATSLEACMASSIPQARNGTLYLMVGGREDVFHLVQPVLEQLSAHLRYIGPAGKAAEVKALVNMVMNCNTAALAEGLGLGEALGIDLGVLREVFSQTGANSRVLETDGADMQNREHDCYFSAEHAAKDSGIADSLAKSAGLRLPLNEATLAQYKLMVSHGLGNLDKSGIAELTFKGRAG